MKTCPLVPRADYLVSPLLQLLTYLTDFHENSCECYSLENTSRPYLTNSRNQ